MVSCYGAMWGYSIREIMHLSYILLAKLFEKSIFTVDKIQLLRFNVIFDLALQSCLVLSAESRVKFLPSEVIHPSSKDRNNLKVEYLSVVSPTVLIWKYFSAV